MFGGPGPRGGVQGATQFLETTKRIAQIPGVEVHVQVHSWLASYPYPNGGIFERAQKLAQRKAGEPHPFVDQRRLGPVGEDRAGGRRGLSRGAKAEGRALSFSGTSGN